MRKYSWISYAHLLICISHPLVNFTYKFLVILTILPVVITDFQWEVYNLEFQITDFKKI